MPKTIKAITHFIEGGPIKQKGPNIHYVRVAQNFGYYFSIKGIVYGDYIVVAAPITPVAINEAFNLLRMKADEDIQKILNA